jgi:arginase family enzyme
VTRRYAILEAVLGRGEFPVVLGGDCSLLLGCRDAADRERHGCQHWDEGIAILRAALASDRAVGLQVAIYNPDMDHDGSNGRELAAAIRSALC